MCGFFQEKHVCKESLRDFFARTPYNNGKAEGWRLNEKDS